MNERAAADAFAALGHPARLFLLRALLACWPERIASAALGDLVGVPPSTLSGHLAALERAGLVSGRRQGRHLLVQADRLGTEQLIGFLTQSCCFGVPQGCGLADPFAPWRLIMTDARVMNVLFLCTANSARSVIAEAILNRLGSGRFRAFSAGSHPRGTINPMTLDILRTANHDVSTMRSKGWEEFSLPDAPPLDFVFTVCDQAAAEMCPVWPGQPMSAHWGLPDPAAVEGSEAERRAAFAEAYKMLNTRIGIFVSLPFTSLDKLALKKRLDAIGSTAPAQTEAL